MTPYERHIVDKYIAEYFSIDRWAEDCHISLKEAYRLLILNETTK
tara:strand:+ start:717 stop:851 length:135 start_codon:yes stop_codon:yes gene_type:complete